jgi:signal transduction histidine kinase
LESPPDIIDALITIYAFFACTAFLLARRRQADREYATYALYCFTVCAVEVARRETHTGIPVLSTLAGHGVILAFAFALHYCVAYARVAKPILWLAPTYTIAAFYMFLNARGLLVDSQRAAADFRLAFFDAPLLPLGRSFIGVAALGMIVGLQLLVRALVDRRRDALPAVVGTALLLAVTASTLYTQGGLRSAHVGQLGFFAFAIGIAASFSVRYTTLATDLDSRTVELSRASMELQRSYEDLRTTQEELVRKEQLAVVGELAAVVAHEVRNPLAVISNAVAGLRKATLTREDHATLLTILDEETVRLNRLVSDLLRYARPVSIQKSNVPLADLLERALRLARNETSISIETKVDLENARIYGDSSLLRQVFDNIVENAVQAMGETGTLSVYVREKEEEGTQGVAIDFVDTGEGMDTLVKARAKDPFFTTRPSGTGLGLAIVDRIVVAHGGHLLIDSRAGEGTTVTVFLPVGRSSEPHPPPKEAA